MPNRPARSLSRCVAALLLAACASAFAQQPPRAAAPSPAATGSRLDAGEAATLLREHNRTRAQVGVAPLRWSPPLAASAQRWADRLAAGSCRMQHSQGGYGENLFIGTAGYYGVQDAARMWAAEQRFYHGGPLDPYDWAPSGHYTQMIWRDTHQLGCGLSECDDKLIVVCHYDPRGNYLGRAPY